MSLQPLTSVELAAAKLRAMAAEMIREAERLEAHGPERKKQRRFVPLIDPRKPNNKAGHHG
jgi:hypothetical protein